MISIRLCKTVRICVVLILSTCGLAANAQDGPSDGVSDGMIAIDGQTPWLGYDQTRFGLGHTTGNGVGYTRDFTTLEAFVPFVYSDGNGIIFGDGRALLESDLGPRGLNLGIGHRSYSPGFDGLIGTYLYYDYRETDRSSFQQLSPGIEILTDRWDLRLNAYIPAIFEDRQPIENRFVGNFLLIDRAEMAYTGFDAEFGLSIPALEQFHTRLYGGGYYFKASKGRKALGWKTRAETRLSGLLTFDLSLQQDDLFDTTLNSTLTLRLPRNGLAGLFQRDQNSNERAGQFRRLTDRVQRQQNIVVDQDSGEVARNPNTGQPLSFLHVANGENGDGSFETPYDGLEPAFADVRYVSESTDVIYVRQMCSSPIVGSDADVTLNSDFQLLSNRALQQVATHTGVETLPFSGFHPGFGTLPDCDILLAAELINDALATANVQEPLPSIGGNIRLGNNTTISGFEFSKPIVAENVSGFSIRDNVFRNDQATAPAAAAIRLTGDVSGSIVRNLGIGASNPGTSVMMPPTQQHGLLIENAAFTGEITGNTFTNYLNDGIRITNSGVNGSLSGNGLISNEVGLRVDSSTMRGDIRRNNISSIFGTVIENLSDVTGDFAQNIVNANPRGGLIIDQSNLTGQVTGNQFLKNSVNAGGGVFLNNSGTLTGDIRSNFFDDNFISILALDGSRLNGGVSSNVFRNSTRQAILMVGSAPIGSPVTIQIADNTFSGNFPTEFRDTFIRNESDGELRVIFDRNSTDNALGPSGFNFVFENASGGMLTLFPQDGTGFSGENVGVVGLDGVLVTP